MKVGAGRVSGGGGGWFGWVGGGGGGISITLEGFSSHKMVLWQAKKFVVCGVIRLENCLEIKYNQENL